MSLLKTSNVARRVQSAAEFGKVAVLSAAIPPSARFPC
jgi:hypothetical protein